MNSQAAAFLAEARKGLGLAGRPNYITQWYAARHGQAFLRASWCDMAVSYWGARAGLGDLVGEFAYCPYHKAWLQSLGRWKAQGAPGDLVFFDWDDDRVADHIGVVETVRADGAYVTIEGNTSDQVARRVRYSRDILGFGRPAWRPDPAAPPASTYPGTVYKRGARGELVKKIQRKLIAKGFPLHSGADGVFGPEVEAAVRAFQRVMHVTVDGQVGPVTWGGLFG